jgi:hypothetical protein
MSKNFNGYCHYIQKETGDYNLLHEYDWIQILFYL